MPDDLTTDVTARAGRRGRDDAAVRAMVRDHALWLEGRGGRRATGVGVKGGDEKLGTVAGLSLIVEF